MATKDIVLNVRTELSPIISKGIRAIIVETLIAHQYTNGNCSCGQAKWGDSFGEHVAQLVMESL